MTAILTPDIRALCAALDAGDNSALPILADALDEAGDPRAATLRQTSLHAPTARVAGPVPLRLWGWRPPVGFGQRTMPGAKYTETHMADLVPATFARLRDNVMPGLADGRWYPTRSDAYLALAAALTPEAK